MKLSTDSQHLVKLEQSKKLQDIRHDRRTEIYRYQMLSGESGGARVALDKEYIRIANDIADATIELYLSAFRSEGITPDEQDVSEIVRELVNVVHSIWYDGTHQPCPQSGQEFNAIVPRARLKLLTQIKGMGREGRAMQGQNTIYNISGVNTRVNVNSADSSINVVTIAPDQLFAEIRTSITRDIAPSERRDEILRILGEFEAAQGTPNFLTRYQQFVGVLADHIGVIQAFLPAIAQMLS